jgi:hypothetical protein
MNKISTLTKDDTGRSLGPSPMSGHREKMAFYKSGIGLLLDTKFSATFLADFSVSRTGKNCEK